MSPSVPTPPLHPLLEAAARGILPDWAKARAGRRAHMARVSALMREWAEARTEPPGEARRWAAAGYLHDALRDADHEELRALVEARFRELPGKVLHGPGVAARLRADGVADEELLQAISFHTLGSASFESLGRALFAADFLEPGRTLHEEWRRELRGRAAGDLDGVVREILAARIGYLVERGRPLRPETVEFWNRMSEGQGWSSASEL
jgi:HD superfamily phosphohydrolase YqeK